MSATTCCSQGGTAFAMTECKQSSFGFQDCGSREIVARFDGGTISSDGGAVLLRQTDHRLDLLPRLAQCFLDGRDPDRVQHSVQEMISQRVYGLALGYEDINDHEQLRSDPLFSVLAGREELEKPLAGKSTLNRLELGDGREDRYKKITFWKQGIGVVYGLGLAGKPRLRRIIGGEIWEAAEQWKTTGQPARVFSEFTYRAKKTKKGGWERERRVVAKAEHLEGKENPRFIVTSR